VEDQLAADVHGPEEIRWFFQPIAGDLPKEGWIFFVHPVLCGKRSPSDGRQEKDEDGYRRTKPKRGRSHYKGSYSDTDTIQDATKTLIHEKYFIWKGVLFSVPLPAWKIHDSRSGTVRPGLCGKGSKVTPP
jgi:hypothetical protein